MRAVARVLGCLALATAVVLPVSNCGKSSKSPTAPPAQLPNDPNATAPPLTCTNHFRPDTTWIEVVPTTDDVEIKNISLSYQPAQGEAWIPLGSAQMKNPIVARFTSGCIAVPGIHSVHAYAVILWLDIRRTPYRTWFHVREE